MARWTGQPPLNVRARPVLDRGQAHPSRLHAAPNAPPPAATHTTRNTAATHLRQCPLHSVLGLLCTQRLDGRFALAAHDVGVQARLCRTASLAGVAHRSSARCRPGSTWTAETESTDDAVLSGGDAGVGRGKAGGGGQPREGRGRARGLARSFPRGARPPPPQGERDGGKQRADGKDATGRRSRQRWHTSSSNPRAPLLPAVRALAGPRAYGAASPARALHRMCALGCG